MQKKTKNNNENMNNRNFCDTTAEREIQLNDHFNLGKTLCLNCKSFYNSLFTWPNQISYCNGWSDFDLQGRDWRQMIF